MDEVVFRTHWLDHDCDQALRGPHAGLIPLVVSFSRFFRPLEIRCGNRPFGPPSPLRPAVNWCTSTVLHTSYNLQFHQSQLTYEPVRLWSVDRNRNTRRKIPGERTNSVQTESLMLSGSNSTAAPPCRLLIYTMGN